MNHRCHLVLTENGHQFQNTSSMEIKRRYKRCNEEKKEMAVSIPTSTINQVTMLAIFYIMLNVHIIIMIIITTYTVNQFQGSWPSAPPFHPHLNRTLPSSTISCMPIVYIAIITTLFTTIILLIVNFSSLELVPSP